MNPNDFRGAGSRKGHLTPKKVMVTKNGRTFEQTVYVSNEQDTPSEARPKKTPEEARKMAMDIGRNLENDKLIAEARKSGALEGEPSDNEGVERMRALNGIMDFLKQGKTFDIPKAPKTQENAKESEKRPLQRPSLEQKFAERERERKEGFAKRKERRANEKVETFFDKDLPISAKYNKLSDIGKAVACITGIVPEDSRAQNYLIEHLQDGHMGNFKEDETKAGLLEQLKSGATEGFAIPKNAQIKTTMRTITNELLKNHLIRDINDGGERDIGMKTHVYDIFEVGDQDNLKTFKSIKEEESDLIFHGTAGRGKAMQSILGKDGKFKLAESSTGSTLGKGVYLAKYGTQASMFIGSGRKMVGERGTVFGCVAKFGKTEKTDTRSEIVNQKKMDAGADTMQLDMKDKPTEYCVKDPNRVLIKYVFDVELIAKDEYGR